MLESSAIQLVSDRAVQAHSGCVFTESVLVPPSPSRTASACVTDTLHLSGEGPVETAVVDPQLTLIALMNATASRPSLGR